MFELPKVESLLLRPSIQNCIDCRFLMPGWIPLDESDPEGHLQAALELHLKHYGRNAEKNEKKIQRFKVKNYTVSFDGDTYSCECPGFRFRKTCKHIKSIEENIAIEEIEKKGK